MKITSVISAHDVTAFKSFTKVRVHSYCHSNVSQRPEGNQRNRTWRKTRSPVYTHKDKNVSKRYQYI